MVTGPPSMCMPAADFLLEVCATIAEPLVLWNKVLAWLTAQLEKPLGENDQLSWHRWLQGSWRPRLHRLLGREGMCAPLLDDVAKMAPAADAPVGLLRDVLLQVLILAMPVEVERWWKDAERTCSGGTKVLTPAGRSPMSAHRWGSFLELAGEGGLHAELRRRFRVFMQELAGAIRSWGSCSSEVQRLLCNATELALDRGFETEARGIVGALVPCTSGEELRGALSFLGTTAAVSGAGRRGVRPAEEASAPISLLTQLASLQRTLAASCAVLRRHLAGESATAARATGLDQACKDLLAAAEAFLALADSLPACLRHTPSKAVLQCAAFFASSVVRVVQELQQQQQDEPGPTAKKKGRSAVGRLQESALVTADKWPDVQTLLQKLHGRIQAGPRSLGQGLETLVAQSLSMLSKGASTTAIGAHVCKMLDAGGPLFSALPCCTCGPRKGLTLDVLAELYEEAQGKGAIIRIACDLTGSPLQRRAAAAVLQRWRSIRIEARQARGAGKYEVLSTFDIPRRRPAATGSEIVNGGTAVVAQRALPSSVRLGDEPAYVHVAVRDFSCAVIASGRTFLLRTHQGSRADMGAPRSARGH